MKEYQLALPNAAGGAAIGNGAQHSSSSANSGITPATGDLFGGIQPAQSSGGVSSIYVTPDVTPKSAVNDSAQTMPPPISKIPVRKTASPNNVINQMGLFETWNISGDKTIDTTTLEFSGLTVQQIKQILQRIPSSYQVGLSINYEDGGQA
jgi:hypothetical protein